MTEMIDLLRRNSNSYATCVGQKTGSERQRQTQNEGENGGIVQKQGKIDMRGTTTFIQKYLGSFYKRKRRIPRVI